MATNGSGGRRGDADDPAGGGRVNGQTFDPLVERSSLDLDAHAACRGAPVAPPAPAPRDRRLSWASSLPVLLVASALVCAAGSARAEDTEAPSVEDTPAKDTPAKDTPAKDKAVDDTAAAAEARGSDEASEPASAAVPSTGPSAGRSALSGLIDDMLESAHGSISVEYRNRHVSRDTDQDIYNWIDLRFGNETTDRVSATFFARTTTDLDAQRTRRNGSYAFASVQDSHDASFNARLYSAYLTWRPADGVASMARVGRQYVHAAETFHLDGVYAESRELHEKTHMTASVYGGVPVHLYESSPSGDWISGASISAEPFRWTRATVDYVHVSDDYNGAVRDDLAALRIWQRANPWLDLYGRVSYLDALRDVELRATARFDEHDLIIQATWFRLLDAMDEEFTSDLDPYFYVLHTLEEYDQGRLRVVKGFGEDVVVEAGVDFRDVRDHRDLGTYNRDSHRYYVMPTFDDLLWDGAELTLIAERWSGNGDRLETYGGEVSQDLSDDVELSIGSDYSLYGYDGFRDRERNHVRSVFWDLRWQLSDRLSLRGRYSHEKDDEETYDVFTLGLTLAF